MSSYTISLDKVGGVDVVDVDVLVFSLTDEVRVTPEKKSDYCIAEITKINTKYCLLIYTIK